MQTTMDIEDSNVIPFEKHQTRQKQLGTKRLESHAIAQCRSIFSERMGELLQAFFAKADDELYKRSERAENSAMQNLFFENMRYLRRERDAIQGFYMQELLSQYDAFWRHQTMRAQTKEEPVRELSEDAMTLVEDEILEENLAVASMVEKGGNLFRKDLFALDKRFAVLLEAPDERVESNPLAPQAVCRTFETVMKTLNIEFQVKLLIYKLFDNLVLSAFGKVYAELNAYLIGEGVLPVIAKPKRRSPAGGNAGSGASTDHGEGEPPDMQEFADNPASMEAFLSMQSLLDGWRQQLGLPAMAARASLTGPSFDSGEVINALSLLQHPQFAPAGDAALTGEALKLYVADQLGKLFPGGDNRPMGRLEEDIIDMVGMVFDYILDDRNLPDMVKALVARLQIPVVKIAILEKSFFAKKNHPARVLLNSLAQAGVGLDPGDSDNPIFKKIEEIVGRILKEFEQNVALFYELLEDFTVFMEKDSQRSRLAEERTRQVTQSKEQNVLAKRQAAYEIALRLRGTGSPVQVRTFLYNVWKDVLVLSYLRRDKDSEDWENAVALMDKLIWSVAPPANAEERRVIVRSIPPLIQGIKNRLEGLSIEPHRIQEVLSELEACHAAVLNPGSVKKDADLADEILDIKSHLPDIDNIALDEVEVAEFDEDILLDDVKETKAAPGDAFMESAKALSVGEWVEFASEDGKHSRAKLSWKSQVTESYVFVNRKGVKVAEYKMADLASLLREGKARIIEGVAIPLMDRALSALMNTLKNPGNEDRNASFKA
jgi:hypothetical protein